MGRFVPDLRRKLELLKRNGQHREAKGLAAQLGVEVSTLNGWVTGSWKSAPESVPNKRMPSLLNLFAQTLPSSLSTGQIEDLVLGSISALEDAYRAGSEVLLDNILTSEARLNTGRLHRKALLGLVEHDEEKDDDSVPSVRLDERFFLEFTISRGGYLLALQNAQQSWGIVKFAGAVSPKTSPGSALLPGISDAKIIYMRESNNLGLHRFLLFVSPAPFPLVIEQAAAAGKSLDWSMLGELARHHVQQSRHQREVHMLHLHVVRG